jgi:putative endonuclease
MAISVGASDLGILGENFTTQFLVDRNYQVLDRNWRVREGEIDIVALSPEGKVVFVEVKTRSSIAYGDPLEAISNDKAMRIQRLALAWLATHQRLGCDFRIDAAGILVSRSGAITIDYREGIL